MSERAAPLRVADGLREYPLPRTPPDRGIGARSCEVQPLVLPHRPALQCVADPVRDCLADQVARSTRLRHPLHARHSLHARFSRASMVSPVAEEDHGRPRAERPRAVSLAHAERQSPAQMSALIVSATSRVPPLIRNTRPRDSAKASAQPAGRLLQRISQIRAVPASRLSPRRNFRQADVVRQGRGCRRSSPHSPDRLEPEKQAFLTPKHSFRC